MDRREAINSLVRDFWVNLGTPLALAAMMATGFVLGGESKYIVGIFIMLPVSIFLAWKAYDAHARECAANWAEGFVRGIESTED